MSGIPEVDFDGVEEVVGAGSNAYSVYKPIVLSRLGVPTPVTIKSHGFVVPGNGTITATFKAADTVPYGPMTAYFVVIEEVTPSYPWTAREVATEPITLSAPGDSMVVTKNFTVGWGAVGDLQVVVWLEDDSPHQIIQSHLMPDPYALQIASPLFASEIGYGETATYTATLTNIGTATDTVTITINQDELPGGVSSTDWEASYREVGGSWQTGPSEFIMNPGEYTDLEIRMVDNIGTTSGMALTTVTSTSGGNPGRTAVASYATFVETPSILLVADDMGWGNEVHWENALADTGYVARTWVVDDLDTPSLEQLSSYWAVLWTNANGNAFSFTGEAEQAVMDYLDGGGNLFLASMNFLSSRLTTDTFIQDYLHVASWTDDNGQINVDGVPGDAISDGMAFSLYYGPPPNSGDTVITDGAPDTTFTSSAGIQGIKIEENDHKIVFTTFPFEGINPAGTPPSNRTVLIGRVLAWFDLETGVGDDEIHRLALEQNVPNPFNPVTKLAFTVPDNAGRVTLTVHNVSGQIVRTLVDGELPAGPALVEWDGTDASGQSLATGIYFAKLEAAGQSAFRKMTLLK